MSIEAMKQALEALEENHHLIEEYENPDYVSLYNRRIRALRQAIAEAEKQWVGLTDEDMTKCIVEICNTDDGTGDTRDLIRAVEAKLKEKNT